MLLRRVAAALEVTAEVATLALVPLPAEDDGGAGNSVGGGTILGSIAIGMACEVVCSAGNVGDGLAFDVALETAALALAAVRVSIASTSTRPLPLPVNRSL